MKIDNRLGPDRVTGNRYLDQINWVIFIWKFIFGRKIGFRYLCFLLFDEIFRISEKLSF